MKFANRYIVCPSRGSNIDIIPACSGSANKLVVAIVHFKRLGSRHIH